MPSSFDTLRRSGLCFNGLVTPISNLNTKNYLSPDIHDWKYLFLIAALATALSTLLLAFTRNPDTDSRDIFIWLMIWFSIVDQMISLFIASPSLKLVLTRFISAWQIVRHISEGWIHAVSVLSSIALWQTIIKKKIHILSHARDSDDNNIRVFFSPLCCWHALVCPCAQVCGRLWCLVWTLSASGLMINVKLSNCNQNLWSKFNGRFTGISLPSCANEVLILGEGILTQRISYSSGPIKDLMDAFWNWPCIQWVISLHRKKLSPW